MVRSKEVPSEELTVGLGAGVTGYPLEEWQKTVDSFAA